MHDVGIYTHERLSGVCARLNRSAVRLAVCAAAGVLLCGMGVVLRLQWLCVGGLIAGCWAAYYLLDTRLRPLMAEKAFVAHMLAVQPGKKRVHWGGPLPECVYVEGVQVREIRCRKDGQLRVFYLRAEDPVPEIADGTSVQIESVDRFIVRIVPAE